jgi:hypothetical protein
VEKPASFPFASICPRLTSAARRALVTSMVFAASLTSPLPIHAQGCTQCQDNTAATPPQTQAAYRHAIIFMTVTAGTVFLGTLILFKRHR